ncbi:MAG: hypothetical protein QOD39_202 [Mycobacterium sp.]|nr:hypothetical protein [Mycobacterium sp.]
MVVGGGAAGDRRSKENTLSVTGQRFERSVAGEVVISALVTVVVLIGVLWNLPNSDLKRSLTPTLRPIAAATGLQQTWQMYAPDPISGLEDMQVRVRMADGSERVWRFQRGDRVVGPFTWYRWQKLKEQVIRDPASRPGLAHWVVRQLTTPAERPVHVQMMFRNELLPPPGKAGPKPVTVRTLYSESLDGRP